MPVFSELFFLFLQFLSLSVTLLSAFLNQLVVLGCSFPWPQYCQLRPVFGACGCPSGGRRGCTRADAVTTAGWEQEAEGPTPPLHSCFPCTWDPVPSAGARGARGRAPGAPLLTEISTWCDLGARPESRRGVRGARGPRAHFWFPPSWVCAPASAASTAPATWCE